MKVVRLSEKAQFIYIQTHNLVKLIKLFLLAGRRALY